MNRRQQASRLIIVSLFVHSSENVSSCLFAEDLILFFVLFYIELNILRFWSIDFDDIILDFLKFVMGIFSVSSDVFD